MAGYSLKPDFSGSLEEAVKAFLGLPHQGEFSRLFRNNGDGTFSDVSREAGLERAPADHGSQFRGPGQRRIPGLLPGDGRARPADAHSQPDVPQPPGKGLPERHHLGGIRPSAEGPRRLFRRYRQRRRPGHLHRDGGVVFRGRLPESAFPQSGARQPLDHSPAGRREDQPHGAGCAHQGDGGDGRGRTGTSTPPFPAEAASGPPACSRRSDWAGRSGSRPWRSSGP